MEACEDFGELGSVGFCPAGGGPVFGPITVGEFNFEVADLGVGVPIFGVGGEVEMEEFVEECVRYHTLVSQLG